jgi:hypothetical protein
MSSDGRRVDAGRCRGEALDSYNRERTPRTSWVELAGERGTSVSSNPGERRAAGLPTPLAEGTRIIGHFKVSF